MKTETAFDIGLLDYSVCRLSEQDIGAIQGLFDRCLDYMLIVDGRAADPVAVQEEYGPLPPRTLRDDRFIFGIVNRQNDLAGLLEGLRGHPDETTWWIGLLLLVPEIRTLGIGQKVMQGFTEYVRASGGCTIMLGVVDENKRGLSFWKRMGFELVRRTEPQQFGNKVHMVSILRRALLTDGSLGSDGNRNVCSKHRRYIRN